MDLAPTSSSGQARSKGRALLFLVSKQNLNPPIGAFGALKIVKNRLELRKLQPLKVEAIKNTNH
jgi:hypothetical protein